MKYTYTAAALVSVVFAAPALADDCAKACTDAKDLCLGKPNTNRSTCASDYASCLGYNPYEKQPFVEPTACSKSVAPTHTATPVADACASKCIDTHNKCVTSDKNRSTCDSDFSACLGFNPFDKQPYVEPTACAKPAQTSVKPTQTAVADQCAQGCISKHNECLTKKDSNKSTCASDFAGCLGFNPYDKQPYVEPTACAKDVKPTQTAAADQCAQGCIKKHNECLTKKDSNKSTCASDFAGCLGFNPYDKQPYVEPTACAKDVKPTQTSVKPTQTAAADQCAQDCIKKHNECLTKKDSNKSTCASEFAGCLGFNPYEKQPYVEPTACAKEVKPTQSCEPAVPADKCAKECVDKHNKCVTKPGANRSTCDSDFAACLGFNPFAKQPYVEPTACSQTTLMATVKPTAKPTQSCAACVQPAVPEDQCAKECVDKHNKCVTKPGANRSTCDSDFAACLGFNPFAKQPYVEPTACSQTTLTATVKPTAKPTQSCASCVQPAVPEDQCAKDCIKKHNECLTKPGSNKSTCASEFAGCLGFNPYDKQPYVEPTACSKGGVAKPTGMPAVTSKPGGGPKPTGTPSIVTAGADNLKPGLALLALGAAALL